MTDQRIKIMNEIIEGIELIKMYSWEIELFKVIQEKRKKEISAIQHQYNFNVIIKSLTEASILISLVFIIAPYILISK